MRLMSQGLRTLKERYRLERLLGRGGSSAVYLARDLRAERPVAIKEICLEASSPQRRAALLEQFRLEAGILAALEHPGLPRVHDSFVEDDFCYLVMDYIEGSTLLAHVRERGPLPEAESLEIVRQVAGILVYLHDRTPPVVLRDLKPSNLMLSPERRVLVIDFGIAKLHDPQQGLETRTWARGMLTPGFAAPEQYVGGTNTASDLYSLGATLYYALTGRIPPESVDLLTGERQLEDLGTLRPDLRPTTLALVTRLMELRRDQRTPSAREVIDLVDAPDLPTAAAPLRPSAPPDRWHFLREGYRRIRVALAILLTLSAVKANLGPWLPHQDAILRVRSQPAGARVYFAGRLVGRAPLELTAGPGDTIIQVTRDGGMPVIENLRLEAGPQDFEATLVPVEPRTPAEAEALRKLQEPPHWWESGPEPPLGFYPPFRGRAPGPPGWTAKQRLGDVEYYVPDGWRAVEKGEWRTRLEADGGRSLELQGYGSPLGEVLDHEVASALGEGLVLTSLFRSTHRATFRAEAGQHRRMVLLVEQSGRSYRTTFDCDPSPDAGYLVQQVEMLQDHLPFQF